MKKLQKLIFLVPFLMISCASPYLKNYDPINVFLESQKIDNSRLYILQTEKVSNIDPLRIFNGEEGSNHTLPQEETHSLFNSKHWKKMYTKYAKDNIAGKYWRKDDFPSFNFVLENRKLLLSKAYLDKYPNYNDVIYLSEPLYYWNKKYILFSYEIGFPYSGSSTEVIIMKKEEGKWIVIQRIGDYIRT